MKNKNNKNEKLINDIEEMSPQQMTPEQINRAKKNLEFNLTFCEENLIYLNGEPRPFTKRNHDAREYMISEIRRIKHTLKTLNDTATHQPRHR